MHPVGTAGSRLRPRPAPPLGAFVAARPRLPNGLVRHAPGGYREITPPSASGAIRPRRAPSVPGRRLRRCPRGYAWCACWTSAPARTRAAPGSHDGRPRPRSPQCGAIASVQLFLPIVRHEPSGPRPWLVQRVGVGRGQHRTVNVGSDPVIPEPVFAGFETANDRVLVVEGVMAGVLRWRRIAATDVPACRAAAQLEPPPARGEALHASRPARGDRRIDVHLAHLGDQAE
jgi:hypothetical protein